MVRRLQALVAEGAADAARRRGGRSRVRHHEGGRDQPDHALPPEPADETLLMLDRWREGDSNLGPSRKGAALSRRAGA
jgi:hypothetical protein